MIGYGNEPDQRTFTERMTLLICRHCTQGVLILEEQLIGDSKANRRTGGGTISWRGFHWWPLPESQVHSAVPLAIRSVYNEGVSALAANCPRAAAVMARRTLEAIAVDKGEAAGTLAARLNNLATKGLLHPSLAEWAKEVRLVGNLGAHFDPIDTVDSEDAKQLLSFIKELLNFMYVLPWELSERRAKL